MIESARPPLTVTALRLRRFRGVTPAQPLTLEELSPGFTLIYGPNGCGKSTCAEALLQLLWPASVDTMIDLEAEILSGGQPLHIIQHGNRHQTLSGDQPVPPPAGLVPETRQRYHWSLRQLLQAEDRDLARNLAAEMAGGVDFPSLAASLNWDKAPPAPKKLHDTYVEADRAVRERQQEQQALSNEAAQLDSLRVELKTAKDTADRAPKIGQALRILEQEQELRELSIYLEQSPPGMAQLRSDDADSLERDLNEQREAEQTLRTLQQQLRELGGGETGWQTFSTPDIQHTRAELEQLLREYTEQAREFSAAQDRLAEQETREQQLRQTLGPLKDSISATPDGYRHPELRTWIRDVLHLHTLEDRIKVLREAAQDFPDSLKETDPDILRDGRRDLERWLSLQARRNFVAETPFILSALLLLGTSLFVVIALSAPPLWLLVNLPPAGLVAYLWLHRQPRLQQSLQEGYPESLPPPEGWTAEQVTERLRTLEELARHQHQARLKRIDLDRLADAEEQCAEVRERVDTLAEPLRETDPALKPDPEWIAHALEDVQRWRGLRAECAVEETRVSRLDTRLREQREALEKLFHQWDPRIKGDPESCTRGLMERMQTEISHRQQVHLLQQEEQQVRTRLEELQKRGSKLAERVSLPDLNVHELKQRCGLLPEWQQRFRRSEMLTHQVSDARKQLGEAVELLENSAESLQTQLESCREARTRAEELNQRIIELETRIKLARKGRALHEARELRDRRREALREERAQQARTLLGRALIDWLQEQCRLNEQPAVLTAANRNLATFSGNSLQLTLSLDPRESRFLASSPGQPGRPLSRLSGGERTQLLMAVRLAFLQVNEVTAPPLIVDEALGTSDDERAGHIMRALLAMARQGRQIFYFTAQSDEVDKWRRMLDEDSLPHQLIDLQAVRTGQRAAPLEAYAKKSPALPSFARKPEETPEAWAQRLQVPDWTPRQPLEELPLWYVLRDQESTLTSLLQNGVSTLGEWQILYRCGGAGALLSAEAVQTIQLRVDALKHLHRHWRVGHPPTVGPDELLQSGIVSETFQEDILQTLAASDFQASALLDALEAGKVPRWRGQKTEELREFFRTQGNLDDRPPCSPLEAKSRAMADTPGLPAETWPRLLALFYPEEG